MPADRRIAHHELCFGCGQANLFGLGLELEPRDGGGVAGRFFVKQDHQGPPGYAHGGVLAAALDEAMALLLHGQAVGAVTARLQIDLLRAVPVGAFVRVEAALERDDGRKLELSAHAWTEEEEEEGAVARGRATFVRMDRH